MPTYTYRCDKCEKVEDKFIKLADLDNILYCDCEENVELTRLISAPSIQFIGKWFKNAKEY